METSIAPIPKHLSFVLTLQMLGTRFPVYKKNGTIEVQWKFKGKIYSANGKEILNAVD